MTDLKYLHKFDSIKYDCGCRFDFYHGKSIELSSVVPDVDIYKNMCDEHAYRLDNKLKIAHNIRTWKIQERFNK